MRSITRTNTIMKLPITALLSVGILAAPQISLAQPYQIEAEANLSRSNFDFDNGGDADANVLSLSARYYLVPVETVGPWSESAFLQKSSSGGVELSRISGDVDSDTDFTVDAFYVTPDDLIIGGELSSADETDISVFGGRYLDDKTTAIARISLGDVDSLGLEYKTLMQLASGNNLTAEAGVALLDASDTGFEIDASATYYLSDQLGVLGGAAFQDIGDSDQFTLSTGAEYFVSETLAARGGLALGFGDPIDTTTIFVGVIGRF